MSQRKATIWIDLDNSPHVPFFVPIRRELEARGHEVWVTASGRHQVSELATLHGMPHLVLSGGYYGKQKVLKTLGILYRALLLRLALGRHRPDLALSHGSRSQLLAAKALGIPSVVIIDYEFVKFPFLKPDCLILPEIITDASPLHFHRLEKYPGLKEDVYAPDFRPGAGVLEELGIDPLKVVATIRPPASDAHYHNAESERLFSHVVERIAAQGNAVMVMLPRSDGQAERIKEEWAHLVAAGTMVVPDKSVAGLGLIWESDLVVSGGGTMNREAAALGVPVYSIFRGRIGAVDRHLAESGRLTLLETVEDVDRLMKIVKRRRQGGVPPGPNRTLHEIVNHVEAFFRDMSLCPCEDPAPV